MAKIVVFGGGGKVGRSIVAEAVRRGHQVTAVDQDEQAMSRLPKKADTVVGDATARDSVQRHAEGADAVVVAIGGSDRPVHANAARTIVEVIGRGGGNGPTILHVSSGGCLENADGERIVDTRDFPAAERKDALDQADALDVYRGAKGVTWTCITPPPRNFGPGKRREAYRTASDRPVTDAQGSTGISHDDFAMACCDEIEKPRFRNKRFAVGY